MQNKEATVTVSSQEYARFQQLESELSYVKQQLADLQRLIFGKSSERFIPSDSNQLALFSTPEPEVIPSIEQVSYERRKAPKEKPVRTVLPAHLPRQEEIIEPEELREGMKKIGEEVTEILEYTPASLYVRRIVRPKYVSEQKGESGIVIASLPSLTLPKSNAGAGLLAYILISKWVDHLPYHRQIQIFKRSGIALSESTLNGWFTATADLLIPLYEALVRQVQSRSYLQADESPIPVQDNHKKGSTHTGYHWVYHAPVDGLVVFDYQPSRAGSGPAAFLKGFQGSLQTDGYSAYNELGKGGKLTMLACMAHARRYFEKALDNDEKRASEALQVIRQLYRLEADYRDSGQDADAIKALRQEQALPILKQWKTWLDEQQLTTTPKSRIGVAVNYTLNLWPRLCRYVEEGYYQIDNNRIENCIRPLALGRKNYLFAGSHAAAQKAAMMYSFFTTCKLHQVEPYQWLKDVLSRIPDHKVNQLQELLPHNWKPDC